MLNNILFLVNEMLSNSQVLIFAGLSGLLSERSGIINIGIEGTMVLGAFVGAAISFFTEDPLLAIFIAGLSGIFFSSLHALFTVYFCSNQIITGIAINFLGASLAMLLGFSCFKSISTPTLSFKIPLIFDDYFARGTLLSLLEQRISVYLALFSVFLFFSFFKFTKVGLWVRAAGEDPEVLETLGVDVLKVRFFSVLASGFFAGVSGSLISTVIASGYIEGMVGGQGFIAIGMLIFGRWTAIGILKGSLLFSFVKALSLLISQMEKVSALISPKLLITLPYVIVLLSLVIFYKKSYVPKSLGVPFKKL